MPLDPQVKAILETMSALAAPGLSDVSPDVMRQAFEEQGRAQPEGESVAKVVDRQIPGPDGELTVRS